MKNHRNRRSSIVRQAVETLECRRLLAGNLLLSLGDVIREVTPTGGFVRDIPVPGTTLGGSNPTYASAVAVDGAGRIHVARTGASHALLTFANGSWTTRTSADWTVLTTLTDVAVTSTQVLVSDISSATTVPAAIRTFPLTGSAAAGRLGTSYYSGIDVSPAGAIHGIKTGLGITPTYNSISPTGTAGTSVTVHVSASSVAADSASTVFVGRGYGYSVSSLDRYSNGVQNGTVNVAIDGDFDLDIASDGTIAMYGYGINADSFVVLGRTNLTFLDSFAVDLNPGQAPFDITFASADSNANPGGPYTVAEGSNVQLTGGVFFGNATNYEWDLNYNGTTFDIDSTSMTPTFNAASLDGPLTRTIGLRVRDGAGPLSAVATTTVTVNNANPTATFSNSGPVVVGQSATVQFSSQNDPSAADRAAGYKYSYDFENDGTFEIVDSTSASANVPAGILSSAGVKVLHGKITDKDGGATEYTTTLNVNTVVGTVTGAVYEDTDGDGVRDAGEAGIAGRTVFADYNTNFEQDTDEPSAVTNASGAYTISNVTAGPVNLQLLFTDDSDLTAPGIGVQRLIVPGNQTVTATPFGSRKRDDRRFLDPAFGTQGESVIQTSGPTITADEIVQLNDGRFLVAGQRNGLPAVSRFNANGSLDTTFGGGAGFVHPNLPNFVIQSLALLSDQRIVLGGTNGVSQNLDVAVLTTSGAMDTSFSGDGFISIDFGNQNADQFRDLAVGPNDRIYVVGRSQESAPSPVVKSLLAVVTPTGAMDSAFSQDGLATFTFTGNANEPLAIAVEPDGQAVVVGYRTIGAKDVGLAFRVNSNGTLDNTYGSGGTRLVESNFPIRLNDVTIDSSHRAIAVGKGEGSLITRLTSAGNIDTNFAIGGRRDVTFSNSQTVTPSFATDVRTNAAGQIAVGGVVGEGNDRTFGFFLLTTSGQLDTRYMRNGGLAYQFNGSSGPDVLGGLFLRDDNKIVAAGSVGSNLKLGLVRSGDISALGSVSGNVFNDLNNNGVKDVGEGGSAGRVVYLDVDDDGERDSGEPFATTDASGNYVIDSVIPDFYRLALTAPTGFAQSFPVFEDFPNPLFPNIYPGQTLTSQNFGLHEIPPVIEANPGGPYTVAEGGTVQLTGNATGAPINVYEWDFDYDGVTFNVDSTTQSPLFSAANLDGPLTRTVGLRARSGSFPSSPVVTTTLTVENVAPTANFGNNGPINAGQTGTVTFSAQNDSSAADRTAGYKYSFDFNNDGTIEIVDSTSASANLPAGLTASAGTVNVRGIIKDKDGGTRELVTILTINAAPPGATISGTVYLDTDRDGIFDAGETGVAARTIYLDNNNNSIKDAAEPSTVTAADGTYTFTGLAAGTYKIRQILPTGFVQTTPANNFGNNATVTVGQTAANLNFGTAQNVTPTGATIRGTVFLDTDRDGVFDAGEAGVSGRTVYLDLDNDSILDGNERSTTTNSSGVYEFGGLAAGAYKIRQVLPSGFIQTTPSNNFGNNATVSGTQVVTGKNFGTAQNTAPTGGTIRGTVWNDVDRDRNFDSNESGIAGRTVYIDLDNDNVKDGNEPSAVTNSSGVYQISGLAAGTYKVRQILPSGFSQTSPTNGFGNNVTLSTNQTKSGINFGSAANASRALASTTTITPKLDSISKSIFAEELIA